MKRGSGRAASWVATLVLLAGVADASALRVSGTMQTPDGRWLAIVAEGRGTQRLVKVQDRVAGGVVLEIGDKRLLVRHPDGDREYLIGAAASRVLPGQTPRELVVGRFDLSRRTIAALGELDSKTRAAARPPGADEINDVLGLPAGTRIVKVDMRPTQTPTAQLAAMRARLDAGLHSHLWLEGADGLDEVYLMSRPPGAPR